VEKKFEHFLGFQWDQGNIDKNLIKHDVENWECEQVFFNRPRPWTPMIGQPERRNKL